MGHPVFSILILSNVKHRLHVWARVYRGSLNGGLLLNLAEAEEETGPVVGIVDDIRECSEIICTIMTFYNKIFTFVKIFVFNCI